MIPIDHNFQHPSKVGSKQELQLVIESPNGSAVGKWTAARQVSFQGPENHQQMPQALTFMEPIPSFGCIQVYLSEDH